MHKDDWVANEKLWKNAIGTSSNVELEHRLRNSEGIYKWHLTRGLSQKDENGVVVMWVGTSTEIEEQVKQKEELEKAVVERTLEITQTNILLKEKNKEMAHANSEPKSFSYVASHDLQEPLRKIQIFVERILEMDLTLSSIGQDYFKRIQNSANRMQTLIIDLLAYSRANLSEDKFTRTNLNKILQEVLDDLKEEIYQKHATVEADEMCHANIIPFQLRQLMHNMIGNSLKFASPKRSPHIRITSKQIKGSDSENAKLIPEKTYCHIHISDNGIGFESTYSEKIFEVFQRLHAKEAYVGTGIGLSIVKKIVENHNGIITAKGILDEGAIFDIYIPLNKE